MEEIFLERFHDDRKISVSDIITLFRLCEVHYTRSVHRIAKISGIVPVNRKAEFIQHAMTLISDEINFGNFLHECRHLANSFPAASGWLS